MQKDIGLDILRLMDETEAQPPVEKPVEFLASSLKDIRDFPKGVRDECGYQLYKVQLGEQPNDYKPMPTIGPGVEEIRIKDDDGIYRVIYTARLEDAVYVLHAFQKKTEKTSQTDIDLAKRRFKKLLNDRKAAAK